MILWFQPNHGRNKAHQPSRCLPQHGPIFFGVELIRGGESPNDWLGCHSSAHPIWDGKFSNSRKHSFIAPLSWKAHTLPCGKTGALKSECFLLFVYAIFGNQTTHSQASKIRILCWEAISCGWCDVSLKKVKNCQIPWNSSSLGFHKIPSGIRGCWFVRMKIVLHRLQLQEISYNSDLLSLPGNSPASKQHVEGQDLTWSDTTLYIIHTK